MRDIQTGEVIGAVECPGCGAHTPLKVNAQKNVYFFCAKRLGLNAATGKQEVCLTRMNYGRTGSKKIIEQFLSTEKVKDHVQHDDREGPGIGHNGGPALDDEEGTAAIPERAGGLGNALKRFLTE